MLGIHVAKVSKVLESKTSRKTLGDAIDDDCANLNLGLCQIFTHGPLNRKANDIEGVVKSSAKIIIHSSYPTVSIWDVNSSNSNTPKSIKSIMHIVDQLNTGDKIKALGLVVHLPRKNISTIIEALKVLYPYVKTFKTPIWLEMISSKAHPELTYETPEKINALVDAVHSHYAGKWGLCIDTAHVYGSGCDISSKELQKQWFKQLSPDALQQIKLFHLNGTESNLGSGSDKHSILFISTDKLYGDFSKNRNNSGVYSIVKFCKKNKVPIILEINRGSESDADASIKYIYGV